MRTLRLLAREAPLSYGETAAEGGGKVGSVVVGHLLACIEGRRGQEVTSEGGSGGESYRTLLQV